jgi:hypothetical protein
MTSNGFRRKVVTSVALRRAAELLELLAVMFS